MVVAATVFWGTSATLARHVFRDEHVPPLRVVELRLLIACLVLGPWLAWRAPERLRIRREDWGYVLVLGTCGVAAVQGTYYVSIALLGVGLAILIQYLAPTLIVLLDVVRGRPVPGWTWLGIGCALAGTALLIGNLDPVALSAEPWHWVVGFGAAFAFAFYILYSKRGLARYRPETLLFYTFLVAAIAWAFVAPPWTIVAAGYSTKLWGMFLALGVFSTLVPFFFFNAGLQRLSATEAGILATIEPVVASLSAALFLNENLRPLQWLGALLVLAATVIASTRRTEVVAATAERA
jgi:drug/metabolite transporter (DMT)-like permease